MVITKDRGGYCVYYGTCKIGGPYPSEEAAKDAMVRFLESDETPMEQIDKLPAVKSEDWKWERMGYWQECCCNTLVKGTNVSVTMFYIERFDVWKIVVSLVNVANTEEKLTSAITFPGGDPEAARAAAETWCHKLLEVWSLRGVTHE